MPTLVVHGLLDPLVKPAGGVATAKAIPGSRLAHVPRHGPRPAPGPLGRDRRRDRRHGPPGGRHRCAGRTGRARGLVTLDVEGVLLPEIWIAVAERTGIEALRRTTRDEPDYDVLMRGRLGAARPSTG